MDKLGFIHLIKLIVSFFVHLLGGREREMECKYLDKKNK